MVAMAAVAIASKSCEGVALSPGGGGGGGGQKFRKEFLNFFLKGKALLHVLVE